MARAPRAAGLSHRARACPEPGPRSRSGRAAFTAPRDTIGKGNRGGRRRAGYPCAHASCCRASVAGAAQRTVGYDASAGLAAEDFAARRADADPQRPWQSGGALGSPASPWQSGCALGSPAAPLAPRRLAVRPKPARLWRPGRGLNAVHHGSSGTRIFPEPRLVGQTPLPGPRLFGGHASSGRRLFGWTLLPGPRLFPGHLRSGPSSSFDFAAFCTRARDPRALQGSPARRSIQETPRLLWPPLPGLFAGARPRQCSCARTVLASSSSEKGLGSSTASAGIAPSPPGAPSA